MVSLEMVMIDFIFEDNCVIDKTLTKLWVGMRPRPDWTVFIESMGDGIVECERLSRRKTRIIFESESYKNWFILKWT